MAGDEVLRALTAACAAVRPATKQDTVAGVVPRYAASPASVAEASALLRAAAGHDLAVVPRGSGTKLGWGTPPRRCDLVVDTLALDRVVEHASGDLVARVQAGVRLERLADVLAGAGQQLALDGPPEGGGRDGNRPDDGGPASETDGAVPADPAVAGAQAAGTANGRVPRAGMTGGTVGGTIATGVAGPRRLRYGTPRDLVIGITVVRADGTVAHSGGKVVKNVAGYDLGKLFAGSYGTLGLIVEAVFRLHPLPAASAYVTVDCPDPGTARAAVAAAAGSDLAPVAVEVDRPARGRPVRVGVLLEGERSGVTARASVMSGLLGPGATTSPSPPGWWGQAGPAGAGTLIRLAFWADALSQVFAVIDEAAAAAGLDPAVTGSGASGVVYAALGADADPHSVALFVSALRAALARGEADARPASVPAAAAPPVLASAVALYAPPGTADLVDLWGPAPSLPLMRAVKDQFDPGHLMSPGRFAGGI